MPVLSALSIPSVLHRRLEIDDVEIRYRSLWHQWSVQLDEVNDWKIKGGNGSNPCLQLVMSDGRKLYVNDLSMFGIGDVGQTSKKIAKYFKANRRSSRLRAKP